MLQNLFLCFSQSSVGGTHERDSVNRKRAHVPAMASDMKYVCRFFAKENEYDKRPQTMSGDAAEEKRPLRKGPDISEDHARASEVMYPSRVMPASAAFRSRATTALRGSDREIFMGVLSRSGAAISGKKISPTGTRDSFS